MSRCPSCTAELPALSQFCLKCGTRLNGSSPRLDSTRAETQAMVTSPAPSLLRTYSGGEKHRFEPGTLLAGRYRIISRLGKGGMGEVFRADDIMLGQPVALKFLPESAGNNLNLLTRFYDEVRIARQITHTNVCRMYDIGEVDGHPYLSMEYVDGEDLASLLRRIGRLPADKATEFARKMCAGLAAAHAQGVLHRDLKPANIMIDGRGELRLMDFGLAAVAAQIEGSEVRNGTPAYMAPEQLEGREVSVQSDLYALGLVFYEMFTGKMPHQGETVQQILSARKESSITNPSTLVPDMDAAVEKAIRRCLDPDPKMRPASAKALAASLPGGDPLAAALAAGETPSPELVAAAGSSEGLSLKAASSILATFFVLLIAAAVLLPRVEAVNRLRLDAPPEVLESKARDMIRTLGYPEAPRDSATGFGTDGGYLGYLLGRKIRDAEWTRAFGESPDYVWFWYRQSRGLMTARDIGANGAVNPGDPPSTQSGMISVIVDLDGRLRKFTAIPPQVEDVSKAPAATPDWSALFTMARLNIADFQSSPPTWHPLATTDVQAAWTGTYPGSSKLPVRVEAAAFHGRPVYFEVIWPWTTPSRVANNGGGSWTQRLSGLTFVLGAAAVMIAACFIARYNWRMKRVDPRGATRIATFLALTVFLSWVFGAHHVPADSELSLFAEALAGSLFAFAEYWIFYLALEPWVRRYWPQALITWSRVLQGKLRDPMVGRDILIGTTLGLVYVLFISAYSGIDMRFDTSGPPENFSVALLTGTPALIRFALVRGLNAIASALVFFLVLFLLRALVRRQWLAGTLLVVLFTLVNMRNVNPWYVGIPLFVFIFGTVVVAMTRLGLFAVSILLAVVDSVLGASLTSNYGAWYGQSSWIVLVVMSAMALWGFRLSLGERSIWGETPQ
jgi:Protein kinase domain